MVSFIRNVAFDCPDPYALAQFWSEVDDHRTPDGGGWVVLLDPADNEFCVTRSAAERHS